MHNRLHNHEFTVGMNEKLFSLTSLKLIYDQTKCKCISSQKLVAVPNNNTVSKYIKGKALNTQT